MIRNYFRVIHYNQEDCHRKHQDNTRRPGNVPKGPLKILMSGTYRANTKIDNFMKKIFLRTNSPYRMNKYSIVLNRNVYGTSTRIAYVT